MRFSILRKFLVAFLCISLTPLLVVSFYARESLIQLGQSTVENSKRALLDNSTTLLEARARAIARQIELFLKLCVDDLNALSLIQFSPEYYLRFSQGHQRRIWVREKTHDRIREAHPEIPLYLEITYADPTGLERIRILENRIFPGGRDVSLPFWGSFGREDYFNQARDLPKGAVYVSHLLGRHVRRWEQLGEARDVESAVGGMTYRGIIRIAAPVYEHDTFIGVVSLALDHRHLMEYTQHVLPIGDREVVFPSYASGNYAFLFDDQGWIITHPKYWDIRGYDPETRKLVDPRSAGYTEAAIREGRIPFNLLHVPFIHPNYRHVAREALEGRSGVTTTFSVGEVPRVVAYAPIRFDMGEYRETGYFGGVTLGARTDTFNESVEGTVHTIQQSLQVTMQVLLLIIFGTVLLVGILAVVLARSFSEPIRLLDEKVREVTEGHFDVDARIRTGDELESLGHNFQKMGRELEKQRQRLVRSYRALKRSKQAAVRERDFIRSVFSNVVSGLMVVDLSGIVTAVNAKFSRVLGPSLTGAEGRHFAEVFTPFPELLRPISAAFEKKEAVSGELALHRPGPRKYVEYYVRPLDEGGDRDGRSLLVVVRDITRRKQMESYLSRSDRLVSLGTLAAGVAHEIRNPLTGICLMLDDLHDRLIQQKADQELIRTALREIEKLERIITELLEFASQPASDYQWVDINTVIENTLFLINKRCRDQRVLIHRETDDLPPVYMDPEKMKQVLLNITLNALNVMPNGGELHIYTFYQEAMEMLSGAPGMEIRICDTGPGVDPADMDFIFDPFFTRSPKGSGLGLSITHAIVEEHKGKIVVDSKLGRGACFKIFMPVEGEGRNTDEPIS